MDLKGHGDLGLDAAHEVIGIGRREVAGHVLDADGVGAKVGHLLGELHEVGHGVYRARGVGNGALALAAGLLAGLNRGLQVANVVQGVEDAHDVNAVLDGLADNRAHDVIGVVAVAKQVLAAKQHLKLRVLDVGADGAQTVPGVLVEEAQAGIERRASPHLEGAETSLVHGLQDGQHVLDGHARSNLALLAVAQDGLSEHHFICHSPQNLLLE